MMELRIFEDASKNKLFRLKIRLVRIVKRDATGSVNCVQWWMVQFFRLSIENLFFHITYNGYRFQVIFEYKLDLEWEGFDAFADIYQFLIFFFSLNTQKRIDRK